MLWSLLLQTPERAAALGNVDTLNLCAEWEGTVLCLPVRRPPDGQVRRAPLSLVTPPVLSQGHGCFSLGFSSDSGSFIPPGQVGPLNAVVIARLPSNP